MSKYRTLAYWLPKIPLLALLFTFFLPIMLMEVNYYAGLLFIAFYISYWTVKIFEGYYYAIKSYIKLLKTEKINFHDDPLLREEAKEIVHIIIVPIYTEPLDVIEENVLSIVNAEYLYKENITLLLATEARAPNAQKFAEHIIQKYQNSPVKIINIVHPENLPDE